MMRMGPIAFIGEVRKMRNRGSATLQLLAGGYNQRSYSVAQLIDHPKHLLSTGGSAVKRDTEL